MLRETLIYFLTILMLLTIIPGLSLAENDRLSNEKLSIAILSPKDQERVPFRTFVSGKVSDPSAMVWIVTHNMATQAYDVSQRITVRGNGLWKVMFEGATGGMHYELMAFANPKEKLSPGQRLDYWPEAEAKTPLIEIIGSR